MNRNNNPLNIKWADPDDRTKTWNGSEGYDAVGHAIFDHPIMGIRAAMRSLQKKWNNGKRTLRAVLRDWAPASDTQGSIPGRPKNDPDGQALAIGRACDIRPDESLPSPEGDPWLWAKIVWHFSKTEMGEYCPRSIVANGVAEWLEDFVEK